MASSDIGSSLSISGASSLNALMGAPIFDNLESRAPGLKIIQRFFKRWLKIDLTTLAIALTLFGTISSSVSLINQLGAHLWICISRFFVSSISVSGQDKLNSEVLHWLVHNVMPSYKPRILTAQTKRVDFSSPLDYRTLAITDINEEGNQRRPPIFYIPAFGRVWFFHDGNVFILRRVPSQDPETGKYSSNADSFNRVPSGNEDLVVLCLGRSTEPIKRFFKTCQQFLDDQSQKYVRINEPCSTRFGKFWKFQDLRRMRELATVHFDNATKESLVADITDYNSESCQNYYRTRGIPYRRGYLLYGPPGTGKTSLCVALASRFNADLYIIHLPSIDSDVELRQLFADLPGKCFVVLEDIDAVGLQNRRRKSGSDYTPGCTLSGLLNVIDGLSSQEGRIVLMTTNFINELDAALIRPGRIDKKIYLGKLAQTAAKELFLRMYKTDDELETGVTSPELDAMAEEFSHNLPNEMFTPAQVQDYLLEHRGQPRVAIAGLEAWAEQAIILEEKKKKEEEAKAEAEAEAWAKREIQMEEKKQEAKEAKEAKKQESKQAKDEKGKEDQKLDDEKREQEDEENK
ncbi:P-loop containing nucleoside triphosphate hydrolase protein [Xylariaceae sp. FL1651]|nr:P-loop containing nucleoside triphosphate hydrolase protein [Xylariaceae sp. FL1651]